MLWAVLRELAQNHSTQSPEALARALGITPTLVLQLTEELVRLGYLSEVTSCTSGCEGCALHAACEPAMAGSRLWVVTLKGRRALAQREKHAASTPHG